MKKGVQRFRNMTVGKQPGELARLRVVGGPDTGVVFVISAPKVTIGRGEENEIVLTDLKASRKHAEISIAGGAVQVRDLGSANGVMVNGNPFRSLQIKSGDTLGVGQTVMEFVASVEVGATQMIMAPPKRTSAAVGSGTSGLTQFIARPGASAAPGQPSAAKSSVAGKPASFIERNRTLVFALGGLLLLALMLPEVEQKQRAKKRSYIDPRDLEASRGLASLERPQVDPQILKNSDIHFKEGFREYQARNYLRAQMSLETALQIYPDHVQARNYLSSVKKAMEDEAKTAMAGAQRDEEALRLREAKIKYESVKRLYAKDQSNPLYKEADTKVGEVDKHLTEMERH